jgi:hypothetical protein
VIHTYLHHMFGDAKIVTCGRQIRGQVGAAPAPQEANGCGVTVHLLLLEGILHLLLYRLPLLIESRAASPHQHRPV